MPFDASHPDPLPAAPLVALTGATGFIGRHLLRALGDAGWRVRLLLRRDPLSVGWGDLQPEVVAGGLEDETALQRLVEGADAVIHLAGLIKAARREQFFAVNRDGAARLARAVLSHAPHAHVLLVSSLAAREPQLSHYAASKRAGEDAVLDALGTRATVLRPPAVYGPGDRETLVFFQLALKRYVPLLGTPQARAAMIHVDDLVRLIAGLAAGAPQARVLTAADARAEGYLWREVFATAAQAVGNAGPTLFHAPTALLKTLAFVGDAGAAFGAANMLTSQKLRELRHPDWGVTSAELATLSGWAPRFTLADGFADAVAWYRQAGWLPR